VHAFLCVSFPIEYRHLCEVASRRDEAGYYVKLVRAVIREVMSPSLMISSNAINGSVTIVCRLDSKEVQVPNASATWPRHKPWYQLEGTTMFHAIFFGDTNMYFITDEFTEKHSF